MPKIFPWFLVNNDLPENVFLYIKLALAKLNKNHYSFFHYVNQLWDIYIHTYHIVYGTLCITCLYNIYYILYVHKHKNVIHTHTYTIPHSVKICHFAFFIIQLAFLIAV